MISVKTLFAAACSVLLIPAVVAEDIVTKDGKTYSNITVKGETVEAVKILHDGGMANIPKTKLPDEFFVRHEMAPAPASEVQDTKDLAVKMIADFVASTPTFSTKDGRMYKSTEIQAVEPSGLKLFTDSGVVRLRFVDLPEKVKAAFQYDPIKAAEHEREKETQRSKSAEQQMRLSNAASTIDNYSSKAKIYLKRSIGNGWLCDMVTLADQDVVEITSRPGSPLSGPPVLYEARNATQEVVTGTMKEVMVFGFPEYNKILFDHSGRRVWSGKVYAMGTCAYKGLGGEALTTVAFHVDRARAVELVAENGFERQYHPSGEVVVEERGSIVVSGNGTGFAVSTDGYIATSEHVVRDATTVEVYVDGKPRAANVVAVDKVSDLAIIHVPGLATKPLKIVDSDNLPLGTSVFVVGYPLIAQLGANVKLTRGDVNALAKDSEDKSAFQMSAPIQGGNSGGPVCTKEGHVVGVVKMTRSTVGTIEQVTGNALPQNINFAAKAHNLRQLAKSVPQLDLDAPYVPETGLTPEQRVEKSTYLIVITAKK